MSYDTPSMVGILTQYKASPTNKLSVDLLRKTEMSIPVFLPMNIGFNAVRSTIIEKINIQEAILCKTVEVGSISPGRSIKLTAFVAAGLTPLTTGGTAKTFLTASETSPTVPLTSSASETDDEPDASSVLFDEKLNDVVVKINGYVGPQIISLENVGAVNYTTGQPFFDVAAILTMQAAILSTLTPSDNLYQYRTKSLTNLYRTYTDSVYRESASSVAVTSFVSTFTERYNNVLRLTYLAVTGIFKLKAVAPQVTSPDMGKYKYSHVQRLSGRQMFVLSNKDKANTYLLSSSSVGVTGALVYSTNDIAIYMSNDGVGIILDGIKHFHTFSSTDAYDNLVEVKEVTNSPDYKSYLLITKTTSIYLAIRREYTFSGGHLLSFPDDWHLVVIEEGLAVTPYTETGGHTYSGATQASDICAFNELTSLSKILLGTKDLMVMSPSINLTHRYGAQDFKLVSGGWFDQAIVLTQAQGICFALSNTMVIPNPFLSEYYGQQEGINHTMNDATHNIEKPDAETWTNLISARGGTPDWYTKQSSSVADALNSSVVLFETLSIDSNGGFHSLPRAINEIAGYNPMATFVGWSTTFFSIGEEDFVASGTSLHKASGLGKLMPNPDDVVIAGYNSFYNVRSYIIATKKGMVDVFTYDRNQGTVLSATIEGDLICKPEMYNNAMFIATETVDMFNIYKLDRNGVTLVYTDKIKYTKSSCIFTREEGVLVLFHVTDDGTRVYSISDNSISLERDLYDTPGEFISTVIAGVSKVLYREDTTKDLFEITTSANSTFLIESQYIDLTTAGRIFILTGIVIQTESLESTSKYTCVIWVDGAILATVTNSFTTKEERISRHLTGLNPINGLKYNLTGTGIKLNNIKVEGYYQEV